MPAAVRIALLASLVVIFSRTATAQSGFAYAMNDNVPIATAVGETFSVPVRITNNGSYGLVGFTFYVEHDPTMLQFETLTPGGMDGIVPTFPFFALDMLFSCTNGPGLALAQITDFSKDPPSLPVGSTRIVGTLEYTSLMTLPSDSTTLTFGTCDIAPPNDGTVATAVGGVTAPQVEPPALAAPDLIVSAAPGSPFLRGDCDASGVADLSDVVDLLSFVFLAGNPPTCPAGCDFDSGGNVGFSDVIGLVSALYTGTGGLLNTECEFGEPAVTECDLVTANCP